MTRTDANSVDNNDYLQVCDSDELFHINDSGSESDLMSMTPDLSENDGGIVNTQDDKMKYLNYLSQSGICSNFYSEDDLEPIDQGIKTGTTLIWKRCNSKSFVNAVQELNDLDEKTATNGSPFGTSRIRS